VQLFGRAVPGVVQDSRSSISSKFGAGYRLLRADGFDHAIRADNVLDKHFKVFFVRNFKNNARLGIIASKKSLPKSADRNRVKRIIREVFRHHSIKHCRLDLVVKVNAEPSRELCMRIDNLKMLFSQVESRCAD
jgi:ribonuclease P protein component